MSSANAVVGVSTSVLAAIPASKSVRALSEGAVVLAMSPPCKHQGDNGEADDGATADDEPPGLVSHTGLREHAGQVWRILLQPTNGYLRAPIRGYGPTGCQPRAECAQDGDPLTASLVLMRDPPVCPGLRSGPPHARRGQS